MRARHRVRKRVDGGAEKYDTRNVQTKPPACDSPKQCAAALDHFHSQARRTKPARTGLFSI